MNTPRPMATFMTGHVAAVQICAGFMSFFSYCFDNNKNNNDDNNNNNGNNCHNSDNWKILLNLREIKKNKKTLLVDLVI